MAIEACPNACPECPLYDRRPPKPLRATQEHGCYSDRDHIIPKFMGKGAIKLVKRFIHSPENYQQLCRWEHNEKSIEDLQNPPELPDVEFMRAAVRAARG